MYRKVSGSRQTGSRSVSVSSMLEAPTAVAAAAPCARAHRRFGRWTDGEEDGAEGKRERTPAPRTRRFARSCSMLASLTISAFADAVLYRCFMRVQSSWRLEDPPVCSRPAASSRTSPPPGEPFDVGPALSEDRAFCSENAVQLPLSRTITSVLLLANVRVALSSPATTSAASARVSSLHLVTWRFRLFRLSRTAYKRHIRSTLCRIDHTIAGEAAMPPSSGSPSHAGVAKAVRASRAAWINDLRLLLGEARTRNGDVCWRVEGNDDEIYGHKGADRPALLHQ